MCAAVQGAGTFCVQVRDVCSSAETFCMQVCGERESVCCVQVCYVCKCHCVMCTGVSLCDVVVVVVVVVVAVGQTFRPTSSYQLLANYFFIHSTTFRGRGKTGRME